MAAFNVKKIFEEVRPLYNFEFELKDEQISVIESILEKKAYCGCFPYRVWQKCMFLLPPLILDQQKSDVRHVCIVISPLKSLMIDQCKHNFDHGIPAAVMKGMDEMSKEVIEGMI